jgi:hypothetical protein
MHRHHLDHGAHVAARYGIARSPRWKAVARAHLAIQPFCVACGPYSRQVTKKNVHHIFPFHYCVHLGRQDLELDHRNLITLCESGSNHHLLLGHLDDFESANLSVVRHARRTFHALSAAQLEASGAWEHLVSHRLATLRKMTHAERVWFLAKMNQVLPRLGSGGAKNHP